MKATRKIVKTKKVMHEFNYEDPSYDIEVDTTVADVIKWLQTLPQDATLEGYYPEFSSRVPYTREEGIAELERDIGHATWREADLLEKLNKTKDALQRDTEILAALKGEVV